MNVGQEARDFTINPFSLPQTKENLQFLFSFFRVLIVRARPGSLDSRARKPLLLDLLLTLLQLLRELFRSFHCPGGPNRFGRCCRSSCPGVPGFFSASERSGALGAESSLDMSSVCNGC